MRVMLHAVLPTESGNEMIRSGMLQNFVRGLVEDVQPEALYFMEDDGCRSVYMVFDMKNSSELPGISEPFFLAMNAKVTVRPVMTVQDLVDAGPGIERAVRASREIVPA